MGLWTPAPELGPGETVVSSMTANHTQGARAVGERLFVTDSALRFVVNRVDDVAARIGEWASAT